MKIHIAFYSLLVGMLFSCQDETDPTPSSNIPVVYQEEAFTVSSISNVTYGTGLSHTVINGSSSVTMPLELDVYLPDNDDENRPAFVFIHGGGFIGGDKTQDAIVQLGEYFASRGWVFFSVNYRLRDDLGTVPEEWLTYSTFLEEEFQSQFLAIYPAQRDAKAALRWVAANASSYNINTDFITVGGGSAGAITAITAGISEPEDFRDELNVNQDPTLENTYLEQPYRIRTIIDFWGSKVAMDGLEEIYGFDRFDAEDPPLLVVHGTNDTTVPFSGAEELKEIYDGLGLPLAYYPIEGAGHGIWNTTVQGKGIDELSFDFIVEQQGLTIGN